jgi:hypothetical protein
MEFQCDFKYLTQYEHRIKVKTTFIEKPPIAANFPSNKIIQQDISATFSSSLNSSGLQNNTCPHHSNEEKRVSISVLSLWQIPEKNTLKGGKINFDSQFQSMIAWLWCFGPEARQSTMVVGACGGRDCSLHGEVARKRRARQRSPEWDIAPKDMYPVFSFLQLDPPPKVSIIPSNVTKLWIHQWIFPLIRSELSWSITS